MDDWRRVTIYGEETGLSRSRFALTSTWRASVRAFHWPYLLRRFKPTRRLGRRQGFASEASMMRLTLSERNQIQNQFHLRDYSSGTWLHNCHSLEGAYAPKM